MVKISFEDSVLEINANGNAKRIDLKYPIAEALVSAERIIVRFKMVGHETPDKNVICLDDSGLKIWQVEDPDMWRVGRKKTPRDLFGGIYFDKNGKLWGNGGQFRYRIDVSTGKILEYEYTK